MVSYRLVRLLSSLVLSSLPRASITRWTHANHEPIINGPLAGWRHFTTKIRTVLVASIVRLIFQLPQLSIPKRKDKFEQESILTKHSGIGSKIPPPCKNDLL